MKNTLSDLEASLDGATGIKEVVYFPKFHSWTIRYFDGSEINNIESSELIEYIDNI
jgi:hypothetical protein